MNILEIFNTMEKVIFKIQLAVKIIVFEIKEL